MNRVQLYLQRMSELETVAHDPSLPLKERIRALTEIYFMYQGDTHTQARIVRSISGLCQ